MPLVVATMMLNLAWALGETVGAPVAANLSAATSDAVPLLLLSVIMVVTLWPVMRARLSATGTVPADEPNPPATGRRRRCPRPRRPPRRRWPRHRRRSLTAAGRGGPATTPSGSRPASDDRGGRLPRPALPGAGRPRRSCATASSPPRIRRASSTTTCRPTDLLAYHEARARGGVGAIFLEATAVHPSGLLTAHTIGGFLPEIVPAYRAARRAAARARDPAVRPAVPRRPRADLRRAQGARGRAVGDPQPALQVRAARAHRHARSVS